MLLCLANAPSNFYIDDSKSTYRYSAAALLPHWLIPEEDFVGMRRELLTVYLFFFNKKIIPPNYPRRLIFSFFSYHAIEYIPVDRDLIQAGFVVSLGHDFCVMRLICAKIFSLCICLVHRFLIVT